MNQQSTVVSYEDMSKQIDLVFDKIMTLIKYNVWSNVSIERFKRWKAQFKSDEERYYAAYLAQKLVFYNKKDFISLISYSFSISIKQITLLEIENKEEMNDIIWRDKIEVTRRNTLVCPLTTDSAASGFMVARLLRDQGIISENELMDSHDDLIRTVRRRNTMSVIFVDDMIGSGTQVRETLLNRKALVKQFKSVLEMLKEIQPDIRLMISVAVAPKQPVISLQNETGLIINVAEWLTEKNDVSNHKFWGDGRYEQGLEFLKNIEQLTRIPRTGFLDNAWAVTFEHGAPDVSCPFYKEESNGWTSLVRRRGEDL